MDYDSGDYAKPRFQLQSGSGAGSGANEKTFKKLHVGICCSVGVVLLACSWYCTGPLQWMAFWLGLSLVVGPFAPTMLTGGDCTPATGEAVIFEDQPEDTSAKPSAPFPSKGKDSSKPRDMPREEVSIKAGGSDSKVPQEAAGGGSKDFGSQQQNGKAEKTSTEAGERDWTLEEIELLKKLMQKYPRGTLRRWEVIAEALGGHHSADDVVKMSKSTGQYKVGDEGSFLKFLAQRKGGAGVAIASPLTKRDSGDAIEDENVETGEKRKWSEAEDKALLTALKTFPKDSAMRWDKVALAIPGRSKAQCFTRFSELRKNFRKTVGAGAAHDEL